MQALKKRQKKYTKDQVEELIKKMSQMDVMKDEIKEMEDVRVKIIQRLIQVEGDLYEYSPFLDDDILRAKQVFLSIDQTDDYDYILNVIDM